MGTQRSGFDVGSSPSRQTVTIANGTLSVVKPAQAGHLDIMLSLATYTILVCSVVVWLEQGWPGEAEHAIDGCYS